MTSHAFSRLFACVALSVWLAACAIPLPAPPARTGDPPVAPTPIRMKVCYSSASSTMTPALYAHAKGLFAKHGLEVEMIYISGGSRALTAMIAGEVDLCQISASAVVNAAVAGEDTVIIAGLFNTYLYSLMVPPEIRTPDDLRGGALAISTFGGSADTATRVALQRLGLAPDEDVAILSIGGQLERLAAMEAGAVQGTLISVPETSEARARGYHSLLDMSDLNVPYQHTTIATTRGYLASQHEAVERFMKALLEALAMMQHDRAGTIEVIANTMLLDTEENAASLQEAYDEVILKYLQTVPYPTLPGLQVHLDELVAEVPAAADVRPEDLVDTSILDALVSSGFVDELNK